MKVILRSSSLPLTILGILTNVGVARVDTGLRRGMAGRVRIGMRLEDLESEPGLSYTVTPDVPEVGVFLGAARESEPALIAEFSSGVLSRCRVLSRRYRTASGIGIGSQSSDLQRAYPIVWQETGVALVESLAMQFAIREGRVVSILIS